MVSDANKATYANIKTAWASYQTLSRELVNAASDNKDSAVVSGVQARLVNELDPYYNSMLKDLASLMDLKVEQGDARSAEANNAVMLGVGVVGTMIVLAMLLGMFFSAKISNGIAKPLAQCVKRLQDLANGDLHSPLPQVNSNDEIGDMVEASRMVIADLTTVIRDIEHLLGEMGNGNFDIAISSWANPVGTPDYGCRGIWESIGDSNLTGINDSKLDELVNKAAGETADVYINTYSEAEKYVVEEQTYMTPLYQNVSGRPFNKILKEDSVEPNQRWEHFDYVDEYLRD